MKNLNEIPEHEFVKCKIDTQGAITVNNCFMYRKGEYLIAFSIDTKHRSGEVMSTGSDNDIPLIMLEATENTHQLRKGKTIDDPTVISFPEYKGWNVYAVNWNKYSVYVCLTNDKTICQPRKTEEEEYQEALKIVNAYQQKHWESLKTFYATPQSDQIKHLHSPAFNPSDYMVLNFDSYHLEKDQIAVATRNFLLAGKPCLKEYEHEGKRYKRISTGTIPHSLANIICSVQIYELIKE